MARASSRRGAREDQFGDVAHGDKISALPTVTADVRQRSVSDIFGPSLIGVTAIVTLAQLFHITTFYFILKWVPKIVADFGFAASSAAGVLCGRTLAERPGAPCSGSSR